MMSRLGYEDPTLALSHFLMTSLTRILNVCGVKPLFVWSQFPWVLNMEPYTVSGMARQDCSGDGGEGRGDGTSGGSPRKKVTISENYELVGVVVHSGQAHAGHYYSFIKDRR